MKPTQDIVGAAIAYLFYPNGSPKLSTVIDRNKASTLPQKGTVSTDFCCTALHS